jgi:hypothetical protein
MQKTTMTTEGLEHTRIVVETWEDLAEVFDNLESGWVFRGQESDWPLEPSIRRYAYGMDCIEAEDITVQNAKRRIHHYLSSEHTPSKAVEWLALIQHYGGPTRLLDWTRSPYVAAFFALENAPQQAKSCVLWAVNSGWCNSGAVRVMRRMSQVPRQEAEALVRGIAEVPDDAFANLTRRGLQAVIVVEPYRLNERLVVQQGTFLCPLDVSAPFLANFAAGRTEARAHVFKVLIPISMRPIALERLTRMNVTRASLFPGLDGFVQSLRQAIVRETPEERSARIARERKGGDSTIREALNQTIAVPPLEVRVSLPSAATIDGNPVPGPESDN